MIQHYSPWPWRGFCENLSEILHWDSNRELQLRSRDWGRRAVRLMRLALKVVMQNDWDFVDVILLYLPNMTTCNALQGMALLCWQFWAFAFIISWFSFCCCCCFSVSRDSSVDVVTGYGLEGSWIELRWGRHFTHPSRPALGPTQPPVQWVSVLFLLGRVAGMWCWPPSPPSAGVKERAELYLYSPSRPSWPVIGWPLPLPFYYHSVLLVMYY
jgi:hypothetical protein